MNLNVPDLHSPEKNEACKWTAGASPSTMKTDGCRGKPQLIICLCIFHLIGMKLKTQLNVFKNPLSPGIESTMASNRRQVPCARKLSKNHTI